MSIPTPRYRIGDVVYRPYTGTVTDRLPCPDCHDTRKWQVTSPAGLQADIPCQRCADRLFRSRELPSLEFQRHTAAVEPLTIGSVRIDTAADSHRDMVEYMCRETGIGSGQIYQQSRLYPTQEEALAVAQAMADEGNAKIRASADHTVKLDMSQFPIDLAVLKRLRDGNFDAWYHYRRLRSDIEELITDEDGSEIAESIRDALKMDVKCRERPAMDRLVGAVQAAIETGEVAELRDAFGLLPDVLKTPAPTRREAA